MTHPCLSCAENSPEYSFAKLGENPQLMFGEKHTDVQFENELEQIRSKLLLMGGTVIEMIKGSLDGLVTANEDSFSNVFELEKKRVCD